MKPPRRETDWDRGFAAGIVCGCLFMFVAVVVALSLAGCKQAEPVIHTRVIIMADSGDDVTAEVHRALSSYAPPVTVNVVPRARHYAGNDTINARTDRADKVASVMAAEGITVGDVATFVYTYGWALVPSPLPFAHWAPAAPGSAEVSHYLFEFTGAVGDTLLRVYAPGTAGAVALRVRAVDVDGLMSPWSEVGLSRGKALPGVGQ